MSSSPAAVAAYSRHWQRQRLASCARDRRNKTPVVPSPSGSIGLRHASTRSHQALVPIVVRLSRRTLIWRRRLELPSQCPRQTCRLSRIANSLAFAALRVWCAPGIAYRGDLWPPPDTDGDAPGGGRAGATHVAKLKTRRWRRVTLFTFTALRGTLRSPRTFLP